MIDVPTKSNIPSKPTSIPPTPTEKQARYPPEASDSSAPHDSSVKKSRLSSDVENVSQLSRSRNTSENQRLRGPSSPPLDFDDDLPPPDDDFPPDDFPSGEPPILQDGDDPPPDDDMLPPPDDFDLPPPDDLLDLSPPTDELNSPFPGNRLPPPQTPPLSNVRTQSSPKPISVSHKSLSRPPSPSQLKFSEPSSQSQHFLPKNSNQLQQSELSLPQKQPSKTRRKSLLDIKADKQAVIAAATENLRNLDKMVDIDTERDSDVVENDLIRESIHTFSKPQNKQGTIHKEDDRSKDNHPPSSSILESMNTTRRASVRIPPPQEERISSTKRQSISLQKRQSISLQPSSEFKQGRRLSVGHNFEKDEIAASTAAKSTHYPDSSDYPPDSHPPHEYDPNSYDYNQNNGNDQGSGSQEDYYEWDQQNYQNQQGDYSSGYNNGQGESHYNQGEESDWNAKYSQQPEEVVEPPPVVEEPIYMRQKSAVAAFGGGSLLGDIRAGAQLRKVAPPPPKIKNARETSLDLIKSGGVQLKRAEPLPTKKATEQRSGAIAAILSNRAQIAGTDSDSDSDSDSDFSDDDLF